MAWIALGSNLGDPERTLLAARRRLAQLSSMPLQASSLWRTTPVDCPPGSPSFLNAAVGLVTEAGLTPETLLDQLQALEREFGRRPKQVQNEARPLDLDLIAFGEEQRATERLTLPHPRATARRFVLAPLAEIAPDLRLPGESKTVSQLLAELRGDEVVQRLAPTRTSFAAQLGSWGTPSSPGPSPSPAP